MRLWHKDLIPILPDNQLRGQWRECRLIAKALHDGNLNHLLVNKVKDYPVDEFNAYTDAVCKELANRGYKVDSWRFYKWRHNMNAPLLSVCFRGWHDDRYLRQCLYNLQEKYDCGGIPPEQWARIVKKFPWIEREAEKALECMG